MINETTALFFKQTITNLVKYCQYICKSELFFKYFVSSNICTRMRNKQLGTNITAGC